MKYDACIVGSGAGAGPIAYELCNNGFKVLILEKGPWFKTEHFSKDEMIASRRKIFTPDLRDECHVLVKRKKINGTQNPLINLEKVFGMETWLEVLPI